MKLVVATLASASLALAFETEWLEFKQKFGKSYKNAQEESHKYRNFLNNYLEIESHNADPVKSKYFRRAINKFSDLSYEEFAATRLMRNQVFQKPKQEDVKGPAEWVYPNPDGVEFECPHTFEKDEDATIPEDYATHLDWRSAEHSPTGFVGVTPIKNQGACGSCYTFSAVSAMEAPLCMTGAYDCENWVGMSEQQILNCGTHINQHDVEYFEGHTEDYPDVNVDDLPETHEMPWYSFQGCYGGLQANVFEHVYNAGGLTCEHMAQYESGDASAFPDNFWNVGECPYTHENQFNFMNESSHGFVGKEICGTPSKNGNKDPELIKQVIFEKGPVTAVFWVGEDFYTLSNDFTNIYVPGEGVCDGQTANHAVNIVGYGTDEVDGEDVDYWIVRNSWGADWADNGYVKVWRGENTCNIEATVLYVHMQKDYDEIMPHDYDNSDDNDDDDDNNDDNNDDNDNDASPMLTFSLATILLANVL